jgi:CheY-like chemotaxis protein
VLDLRMPRLDGIAAARTLRTLPGLQATPILAVSAHAGDEDRQACRAVGVNDVLAKPVDVARLYERLLHWLDAHPAAAPAGTPPIDAALVPLLGVDGIDAAAGLAAIGGRPAVYRRLLRVFVDTHAGDGQRLLQQVQRGDAAAAAALAHRLRGSAATLGLIDVETAAAALEGAIDDAADPAALPLLAQAVVATLADALAHLQAALLP